MATQDKLDTLEALRHQLPDNLHGINANSQLDEQELVRACQSEFEHVRKTMSLERRGELATKLLSYSTKQETFMQRIGSKISNNHVELPDVTVEYRNLCVKTDALVGSAGIPTVGSVPVNFFKRLLGLQAQRETVELSILNNLKGKLEPGRLTLLLGPPSSGKSTFLKVIAGRLKSSGIQRISGDVKYNGHTRDQFHLERTAAFVDQLDNHNPNLTVRETLDFAHACQVGLHGPEFNMPMELMLARIKARRGAAHAPGTDVLGPLPTTASGRVPAASGGSKSSQKPPGSFRSLGSLTSLGSKRHKSVLEEPEDDFEAIMREVWGTGVKTEVVMALLGLAHCKDTPVGDAVFRGISGGERKRLTSAEMLVSSRMVMLMDEISTGLDSATLFSIVRWLAQTTHALHLTTVISLLQPPPEVFQLFDDVILMTEGRILYHGPVTAVLQHFEHLGFVCPSRKDVPSFLLEITTPAGQEEYAVPDLTERWTASRTTSLAPAGSDAAAMNTRGASLELTGARTTPNARLGKDGSAHGGNVNSGAHVMVSGADVLASGGKAVGAGRRRRAMAVTLQEMEDAFWNENEHGVRMLRELETAPFDPARSHPKALVHTPYSLSPMEAVSTVTRRQVTLVLRDKVLLKGRMIQVVVISLLTGSLFYNLGVSVIDARTFFGACFMAILFMSFGGFPQLPITLEMKKVWFKHRGNYFYPAYAQGLAMALSQLPLSLLEGLLFSLIIYFMVGFYVGPGYFFIFYLIIVLASMVASALFRLVGCVCPNMVIANSMAGIVLVLLIITSGFAIVRSDIPPWIIWAYWISPYAYALRALVVNEMTSPKWQDLTGPDPGQSLGNYVLLSFDFYTDRIWIWIAVGFLIGAYLLLTFGAILSLWFQNPEVPRAQLPDQAELDKARAEAEVRRKQLALMRTQVSNRHNSHVQVNLPLPTKPKTVAAAPAPLAGAVAGDIGSDSGSSATARKAVPTVATQEDPVTLAMPGAAHARSGSNSSSSSVLDRSPHGSSSSDPADGIDISSSLPFQPITLVFKDLRYFVPNPAYSRSAAKAAAKAADNAAAASKALVEEAPAVEGGKGEPAAKTEPAPFALSASQERLELLKGVTGYNEPGVLMALMGGSGAGKTTLMDVIAGRKTVGEIRGDIFVNGHPKEQKSWSRVVGYVEQMDIHSPAQTVTEALWFSARLRLPPSVSDTQVRCYVEEVMDIVDLMDCMFALVGSPGVNGLSVEQRKRLTIAVELVANPAVVFMDEPTSGLDARAAAIVMRAVRNVARNGRTVMVTIHQPSIEIFEAFDQLMLIQRGGRTTYFGPLGTHSAELISYLTSVPGTPALPAGYNPATWMLEVTGGSMATMVEPVLADWPALYSGSQLAAEAERRADELVERDRVACRPLAVGSRYAMPLKVQMRVLFKKFNDTYWRSPGYNFMRIFITTVTSFIYGATYWDEGNVTGLSSIATVQNIMGIMFSSSNFLGMTNLMSVMPVVGYERVVFYRERAASMYDPFAYGLAIALVEIPYLLIQAMVFMPIVYFMINFDQSAEKFFYYFIVFFETIAFYTIFGQFLVYITPAQSIAQVVAGGLNFLFNIFNGFVITYPDIPQGWRWMNRIAPPTWILYGLGVSQLGDKTSPLAYAGGILTVKQFMRERFGYEFSLRWWIVLILGAYIIFVRVTSVLALKYWNFLKR